MIATDIPVGSLNTDVRYGHLQQGTYTQRSLIDTVVLHLGYEPTFSYRPSHAHHYAVEDEKAHNKSTITSGKTRRHEVLQWIDIYLV